MRIIRSFLTITSTLLMGSVFAQPFTVQLSGTVPSCAPNSLVEIYEEPGLLQTLAVVDETCSFTATFNVIQPIGTLSFSGSCINGAVAFSFINYEFSAPGDTLFTSVSLVCGNAQVDCQGVAGGNAHPGNPCDDGSATTVLDLWSTDCQCVGLDSSQVVFDCLGVPNGHNLPGSPCLLEDLNGTFPIGLWSADCQCVPDSIFGSYTDCLGVINGPAVAGSPCDDGNASTPIDLWDASCQCIGYDSTAVVFDCQGVAFGGALPGAPCLIDELPFFAIGIWDSNCTCVPDTTFGTIDCLGIQGGGNLPGTPCFTGINELPNGFWNSTCECVPDSLQILYFDCIGIPNGPNLVGAGCTYTTDDGNSAPGIWNADCMCIPDPGAGPLDCAGIPNGPNQPGTPCFDIGNPIGIGFWDLNCTCIVDTTNAPVDCLGIPGGPNMPGLPCSLLPDSSNTVVGIWGPDCICYANTFDCLGTPGGEALPGTACQGVTPDGIPYDGVWGPDCFCYGDSGTFVLDCLGQPNGPNVPGAPCFVDPGFPLPPIGIWNANCECIPDSTLNYVDCLGIENGPNIIGTICDTGDPNVMGYWNPDCQCEAFVMPPCTAGFIVAPGVVDTTSSTPVQLWIWNTSFGGSGNYSYLWDFGDGNTSTDPWPLHEYETFGPYVLCLTITDDAGCSNTFCDTLQVDENGLFGGRSSGFSVSVRPGEAPTGVNEAIVNVPDLQLAPNPTVDQLTINCDVAIAGTAIMRILDMDGRVVREERWTTSSGPNSLTIGTAELATGMYILSLQMGSTTATERFVKTAF